MVTGGKTPVGRIHALWTLEGLEKLDPATVNAALLDQSPKVRAHAIRLAEPFAKADRATQTALFGLEKDSAFDVQVQLMLTLGEIPGTPARELLVKLAARHSESTLGRSAFFSGIGGTELETLRLLAMSPGLSERSRGNAALLEGLATCVWEERNPDRILAALDFVANTKGLEPWKQSAVLTGLGVGASAKVKRPIVLPTEATVLARIKAVPSLTKPAAMIDSMLVWKDKPGWTPPKKAAPLTAADKQWVAAGEQTYMVTCGACHQPHGNGQEGLAPPLTNSEWVSGPSGRLIRIILQGVGGPIETNGKKFNMDMPPLGAALSDEQVAQVASFVRRSFGNEASVIRTEEVASVREKTEDRAGLWTADELLNIP
jgi:mono/diheme cytochrome c family protein